MKLIIEWGRGERVEVTCRLKEAGRGGETFVVTGRYLTAEFVGFLYDSIVARRRLSVWRGAKAGRPRRRAVARTYPIFDRGYSRAFVMLPVK